jgi:hypothetical protein
MEVREPIPESTGGWLHMVCWEDEDWVWVRR